MSDDADKRAAASEPSGPKVDARLLEILVCPVTRAELTYDPVRQELVSRAARLAYPIRHGVPIMLPEEARRLND
ncbi:MAG: Trm112 family protein [Roseiarcus sp.]